MNTYRIADLAVQMVCGGPTLLTQGQPYLGELVGPAQVTVGADYAWLGDQRAKHPRLTDNEWEYIHTGLSFYRQLLDHDGFCLHSAAVAMDGQAVLFSGPCGSGKSTQARLWQERFGPERVTVINADKPALRCLDGCFYAYGTPWSGKTAESVNARAPVSAIVFLQQAAANRIQRLANQDAVRLLLWQSLRPSGDAGRLTRLLELLGQLLRTTPVYQLECTISAEAVELVHRTILGDTAEGVETA